MNRKNWEEKLKDALWAYRITWKNTIGFTPYQLVYGKEVMLPIEFQIHTFKMDTDLGIDLNEAQQERIQQLNQLDEMRQKAKETTLLIDHKAKFTTHWMGPYEIVEVYENGSVQLITTDGEGHPFLVNGHRLKLYHKPITKEDFLKTISQKREVEILQLLAVVSLP
eukprot:PITA_36562